MAAALRATVGGEVHVVHDNRCDTTASLNQLGYRQAPAVNHSTGFFPFEPSHNDGWHSNAAESEISRLKRRVRS
eukprot:15463007-Alexandrium_andersonii.AAC.1